MVNFDFVGQDVTKIGESPVWDPRHERLWWVDIIGCRIAGARLDGSDFVEWRYPQTVGSIGLAEEDGLVAALADGFYRIHPETGAASPIFRPPGIKAPVRFNDGKTDRDGRFLSATMTAGDLQTPNGTLWRLNTAGTAELIERDFIIGNALCFSPDGESLYFSDTMEGTIRQYDYDRTGGGIGNRRDVIDCRPYGSGPDGATVDADGNLWVALIQAQKIACFKPDGALVQLMDVPLPFPACLAFAGEDMDVLIVTGISDSGWTMKAEGPEAGRILAISGLHARGIAETPFRHSHDT